MSTASRPDHIESNGDVDSIAYEGLENLAADVTNLIIGRLQDRDIVKLMQVVFLDTDQVAALFQVKPKTISAWVSAEKIPYRKANGRLLFLLAEILVWTLPENDKHARHRLPAASGSRITSLSLATTGRKKGERNAGL